MKDIGLVGLPFSGKSTLFTALTRTGTHGGQANHAVVQVPDPRLGVLTEMERSRKTVPAQVGFVDVPGGTSSSQGIAKLRESDALAIVIRCFGPSAKPADDLAEVRTELLLADQAVIEPALARAQKRATRRDHTRGRGAHRRRGGARGGAAARRCRPPRGRSAGN